MRWASMPPLYRVHTLRHRGLHAAVEPRRLGLDSSTTTSRRRLDWLGHISRVDSNRLLVACFRRSSWVPPTTGRSDAPTCRTGAASGHPQRPSTARGGPNSRPEIAADRPTWRQTLHDRRRPDALFAMLERTKPPSLRIARTKPETCTARTMRLWTPRYGRLRGRERCDHTSLDRDSARYTVASAQPSPEIAQK